jgi:hypothetical protein
MLGENMDEFDFKEVKAKSPHRFGSAIWNCGCWFFFLATIAAAGFIVLLFLNPLSGLNPFPPVSPTEPPTNTPTLAPVTETPTATLEPTATATVEVISVNFQLQEGSPVYLDASVFHPELGCTFTGVAGQAFGPDGSPVADLQVQVTGTLGDQPINKIGKTGAATQYGAGEYYEVQLGNQPIASEYTLLIAVLDTEGNPISDGIPFSTSASCQENLVLINFSAIQ